MSRFSYTEAQGMAGIPGMLPFISITLLRTGDRVHITQRLTMPALVDSGSTINVLPYEIGEQLGFVWNKQNPDTPEIGTLRGRPALGVQVFAKIERYAPVRLWFAWSQLPSHEIPPIVGQTNFFDKFHVNFRKSTDYFEIFPANLS